MGLYYVSVATFIKGNPDEIPSVGELHPPSIGHFVSSRVGWDLP